MRGESVEHPAEFLLRAAPLLEDEAAHNLFLGIVNTLIRDPGVFEARRLFLVSEGDEVLAAALLTPPYNLVVANCEAEEPIRELVRTVIADGVTVPGVIANVPTVDTVVAKWTEVTGDEATKQMAQGVFAIEDVAMPLPIRGNHRPATLGDRVVIDRFLRDFTAEALPDEPVDDERLEVTILNRLSGEGPNSFWLWVVDGQPVSLSGHGNPTGSGIRIGPVFTPPAERGNGYASALVAAQSRFLLENGYSFCFLYTDLANPTSNAIYQRIGYRQIAESAVYSFRSD
jgi:predicted GNAT family acetyltransferase